MKTKNHTERAHAELAPSGASRWLENCPGSIKLSIGIPEGPSSEAAKEGTVAHEWAEKLLNILSGPNPELYAGALAKLDQEDADMAYYVDEYINFLDKLSEKFQSDEFDEY